MTAECSAPTMTACADVNLRFLRPRVKDEQVSVDSDCFVVTSQVGSFRYQTLPDDFRR